MTSASGPPPRHFAAGAIVTTRQPIPAMRPERPRGEARDGPAAPGDARPVARILAVARAFAPGLVAALALGPAAALPALAPVDGEPVAVIVPPWRAMEEALPAILAAGGRPIDVSGGTVVAGGPPDLASRLFWRDGLLVVSAGPVSCSRR